MSDKGIVFESRVSFSIGDSIELAVHLPYQGRNKGLTSRSSTSKSEFMTSEGIVVSCAPRSAPAGAEPVYEVTLLFPSLQRRDRRKLRHLANAYRHPIHLETHPESATAPSDTEVDPSILGLN